MKSKIDEYSDSDDDQHDAYLERMKAEGKIREEGNDSDDSDGGSGEWETWYCSDFYMMQCKSEGLMFPVFIVLLDESFNPGEEDDDIAEE